MTKLTFELPDEIVALLGTPQEAAARARELLVIELLRAVEISQGKAAELLGISRVEMLDLVKKYQIASGPQTIEELDEEVSRALAYLQSKAVRASD
jgi:predicted HTH domain antitoxin